jgi:hypothetical protein
MVNACARATFILIRSTDLKSRKRWQQLTSIAVFFSQPPRHARVPEPSYVASGWVVVEKIEEGEPWSFD